MAEPFARIFETEKSQLLVYVEYDSEDDTTALHQICKANDVTADAKVKWDGDDQEEKSAKALREYTQEKAERVVESVFKLTSG